MDIGLHIDWIPLAQIIVQRWTFTDTVMNTTCSTENGKQSVAQVFFTT